MRTSLRPLRTPVRAALASVLAGCLLPVAMLAGAAPAHAEVPPAASVPLLGLMASLCPENLPIARVVQGSGEPPGSGLLAAVEQTWVGAGGSRWPSSLASSVAADLRGVTPWVCPPLRAATGGLPATADLPLAGREAEPEAVPDHLSGARTYLGHSTGLARHAAADRPPPVPQVVAPRIASSTAPPAAARPWGGGPAGCTGTDPTSGRGCLTGVARHGLDAVTTAFGSLQGGPVVHTASCWDAHAWNPSSDHPRGRACDLFPTTGGRFPQGRELANGWRLAEWLRANAGPLRVSYLIWQGRYWDPSVTDSGGWGRAYRSSVYDVHDATGGHFDHVHVSFAP
ncbi:MAG: hypothetical protein JWP64_5743 [Pseudonocardia sp.]|uniref:hypothetical protein n=1 Tax=Pseudonocardia sp. TaxID=60912 RepID=UPI00262D2BE1|nr:hypothetical protein [Pseudonocardia sp.]MCU1630794.1 hypothetical protein [Pseudonocardia sp.]MDT7699650.1 hypothetical protein [Pseudonocardiales bacterium]